MKNFKSLIAMLEAFPNEKACVQHLEAIRWRDRAFCPHCGCRKVYHFKDGINHKCADCQKRFSVKVGTIFANYTGTVLEKFILDRLIERKYAFVAPKKFDPACYLEQPIFSRRYYAGLSVYETELYCDFILYHPEKWPNRLIIESKWQQSGGSVDEKYPFLVLNINLRYPCQTIVLIDGGGYKAGAKKWLRDQAGNGNFIKVFGMAEFQKWVNQNNL